MSKSLLAVAVSQLVNPMDLTGTVAAKPAKIPAADMSLQQHDAMTEGDLSVYFDEHRREWIEEFAAVAEDLRYSTETKKDQMAQLAAKIWPTGKVSYNECRTCCDSG